MMILNRQKIIVYYFLADINCKTTIPIKTTSVRIIESRKTSWCANLSKAIKMKMGEILEQKWNLRLFGGFSSLIIKHITTLLIANISDTNIKVLIICLQSKFYNISSSNFGENGIKYRCSIKSNLNAKSLLPKNWIPISLLRQGILCQR